MVAVLALVAGCAHPFDEHLDGLPVKSPKTGKSPYTQPLFSPGGKFAGLPPAVQNTIRAQVGVADIKDIIKDTSSGTAVYQIYFLNSAAFPTLYVSSNGDVLNPDLSVAVRAAHDDIGIAAAAPGDGVKLSDLPPNVMRVIQERAPNAEVASIRKETRNDIVVYVVSFKPEAHAPKLTIAEDGTLVK